MTRLICIILLSILSLNAEESMNINLIEALVKKNMPELKAAELRVRQARIQKDIAMTEFGFQVNASASAERLMASKNLSTFYYPRGEREQFSSSVTVSKSLFSFGRNSATEHLGLAQVLESQINKEVLYRDLVFKARLNYWEVLFRSESKTLALDLEGLRRKEQEDSQGLFEAGLSSKVDVLQSKVNRLSAQDNVESNTLSHEQSLRDFGASIAELEKNFVFEEKLSLPSDLETLFKSTEKSLDESLEIDALIANSKASREKIAELEASKKPELFATASADWTGTETDKMDDAYQGGLSISWTIFSGRRFQRQQLVEKDNIMANELSALAEIRDRKRQFYRLQHEFKALTKRLKNEEQAVALAKENYEIAREQYRAGLITLTQVSDVNFQWIQSQFRYVSLVYESQILRENLLYLSYEGKGSL